MKFTTTKYNEVRDLAPSPKKTILIKNSGNCFSYKCTEEYKQFLDKYGDMIDDFFNDYGTKKEIKDMEIRLLKRHAEEKSPNPYYGEQYDAERLENDPTYKPWEDPDNYLLSMDWEPAMSAEDMTEFISIFKKYMRLK